MSGDDVVDELTRRLAALDRPASPPADRSEELYRRVEPSVGEPAGAADRATEPATTRAGTIDGTSRRPAVLVAAAVVAVSLLGAVWLVQGRHRGETVSADGTAATTYSLDAGWVPIDVASADGRVWVLTRPTDDLGASAAPPEHATLVSMDERTGETLTRTELADAPTLVAAGPEGVWVTHWSTGAVSRIDPVTGEVLGRVVLELPFAVGDGHDARAFPPNDVALGHGSVWVSTFRGAVARVDADELTVDTVVTMPEPLGPSAVAVGADAVWAAAHTSGLVRIDTATNEARTIGLDDLGHAAELVAADGGSVWAAGPVLERGPDGRYEPTGVSGASRLDPVSLEPLAHVEPTRGLLALVASPGGIRSVDVAGTWWTLGDAGAALLDVGVLPDRARVVGDGTRAWLLDPDGGRVEVLDLDR